MDPISGLQQVKKYYPFMTCIVKVNTKTQWPKTVAKILSKIQGVQNFRMDLEGHVEISGTVDPDLLLKLLGKSGRKARLCWFQYGECSSNLFMSNRTANVAPESYGRYIQNGNPPRPKLPSNDDRNPKHVDPNSHDRMLNFERAHEHLHDHKPPPPPLSLAPRTKLPPRAPPDTRDHTLTFEQAHEHLQDLKSLPPPPRTNANSEPGQLSALRVPPLSGEDINCCNLM
ncbi:unnamed protein product [Fraxinus pennsylvanica]|uniref:HMA domain-containing protein n=1 Tax=Fraxinus pennsylvanica TaxID=56036 RepID=A0AAD2AGT1_9LAMI|nr:unnamed protein product [Fraxinus pennsylvanica]